MNNLKKLREKAKKTQNDLRKFLSVDIKTYRAYETGENIPSECCIKLSKYYSDIFHYDVSIDYLLGRIEYPFLDATLRDFADKTHLSEDAIQNIIHEGSENGDNRYIFMLDLLLSDRKVFTELMDNIISLVYPPDFYIDKFFIERLSKMQGREDGSVIISSDNMNQINKDSPDNIYHRLRNILEEVKDKAPDNIIVPNEFHPFTVTYIEDEEV